MNNKVVIMVVGAVAVVAAVVIALTLPIKQNSPSTGTNSVNKASNTQANKAPANSNTQPASASGNVDLKQLLAADPGPNADTEKLKAYSQKVFEASKEADVLDITSCKPTPNVIHFKAGQTIKIKNNETVNHKLASGTTTLVDVPANSKGDQGMKINFDKGPGIYGYTCDGNGPVGIFMLIQ